MKCSCGCGREQLLYESGKPVIFNHLAKHCKDCGILFWKKDLRRGICKDCVIKKSKEQMQPRLEF